MPLPINNPVTAFVLLENRIVTDCDSATLEIFQCPREDLLAQDFFQTFSPPYQADGLDSEHLITAKFTRVTTGEPQFFPWRFLKADGSFIDTEISLKIKDFQDKTYLQVVIIDLSEKKRTNEALLVQKSYSQQLFENSPEAIIIADGTTHILNVNRSFEQMFQYSYQEAVGQHLHQLIVPPDKLAEAREAASRVEKGEKPQGESVRLRKDGSLIHVAYATFPIKTNDHLVGYYIIYNDISAYKEVEAKLKYIGLHDPLTGLYNRACFEQKMQELQADQPDQLGMIVCDIDGLKIINDTLGHKAGDEILVNTSEIIRQCLHDEAFLARIGGDEFVIVLPGYQQKDLEPLCDIIRNNIEFYNNMTTQIPINISIGYSCFEGNRVLSINQLFVEADNNMYRDKICRGKSARSSIVQTLKTALEARDFITEGHAERLEVLVTSIAESLSLPESTINELRLLSQFHDIGKVGIPDSILFKEGPLTKEERSIIQQHSEIGARIAQSAPDLILISDWILKHHEWWNGNGYPFGLVGMEIPLECRILAIADAYDSMTSDRPYRKALPHETAMEEIKRCCGTQFDPEIVEKCLDVLNKYNSIKNRS